MTLDPDAITQVALGALLGALVAVAVSQWWYRRRLNEVQQRLAKVSQVRVQTSQLLMQARRQVEMLGKELEVARRQRTLQRAAAPAASAAAPTHGSAAPAAPVDIVVDGAGFAETVQRAPPQPFADTMPAPELAPPPRR